MATTASLVFLYLLSAAFVLAGFVFTYAWGMKTLGVGFFLIGGWLFIMPMMRKRYS